MSDIKRPGLLDDPAPRPPQRPSLTGSHASPAPAGEAVSILSAVVADDPRVAATPGPVRSGLAIALPWLGVAMLGLIAIVFWMEWSDTRKQPAPSAVAAPAAAPVMKPVPTAAAPAASTSAPALASASGELEPRPVAKIESVSESPPAAEVATSLTPTKTAAATPRSKPAKPAPPSTKAAAAQRSPFAAIENPDPTVRKTRPAPSGTGNRDVDLLAALLSGGTAKPPAASNPPRSKFSTKLSNLEPNLSTGKPEPTPSTRERLSLCNLMASRDTAACRARVCKGLWGVDAACPAGSEPPVRGKQD